VATITVNNIPLSSDRSLLAERALTKDSEWAAPLIWRSEMRNVLTFYMRKRIIDFAHTNRIMDCALELLGGREYEVSSYEVFRLASESNCEFIALAKDLKTALITVDKQLLKDFPSVAISLDDFSRE